MYQIHIIECFDTDLIEQLIWVSFFQNFMFEALLLFEAVRFQREREVILVCHSNAF